MFNRFFFTRHLDDGEILHSVIHKHWIIAVRQMSFPILCLLLSLLFLLLHPGRVMFVVLDVLSFLCATWVVRSFLDYFLDVWMITDQGVIDLEWRGWFNRQSSRILYSDIQGLSYEIAGVLATLLRYGTVTIEKISTGATVSLSTVPQPKKVESKILKNMEAYLHSKNMKNAKHLEEVLSTFVSERIQLESTKKSAPPTKA